MKRVKKTKKKTRCGHKYFQRPDGATVFPYKHGKCLTWDFTCVNTLKDTYLFECAKEAGKAAIGGEKKKDT